MNRVNEYYMLNSNIGFGGQKSLEESANVFSRLLFLWTDKFVYFCFKNKLQLDQISELSSYDKSSYLFNIMNENWEKEKMKKKPSFFRAICKSFGNYFMLSWVFLSLNIASAFIGPEFLKILVKYIIDDRNNPNSIDHNMGYYYAIILFSIQMIGSICLYQSNMIAARTGSRIKSIIVTFVYQKSLKLSNSSKSGISNGEIINIMSNDSQRLLDLFNNINVIIFSIPTIIISMVLLYSCLGWPSFIALLIMTLSLPFNISKGSKLSVLRRRLIGLTDERIKVIHEIFQSIKTIKLFGWDFPFISKVGERRSAEIKSLKAFARFRYSLTLVIQSLPTFVSVCVFTLYYIVNKELPVDKIFASVAYLNLLRIPFSVLPNSYNVYIQFKVSLERVISFLNIDEINNKNKDETNLEIIMNMTEKYDGHHKIGIYMENSTFSWSEKNDYTVVDIEKNQIECSEFSLKNLNIKIEEPGIYMCIGPCGSGKSSFCQSILGEMKLINNGTLKVVGSFSYCSQIPWIQNATLKDNILFGKKFDREKYDKVITACALLEDIGLFPQGDSVEIGERGINLSGGQKQRVAIARAVYSDSDIYILDDILSAVDIHVGKHIFINCILGLLKEKIVILTTNQLNWVPFSTKTLILNSTGNVEIYDTFSNILLSIKNNNNCDFSALLKQYSSRINDDLIQENKIEFDLASKINCNDGKLTSHEAKEGGLVHFNHYSYYFTSGGKFLFVMVIFLYLIDTCFATLTNLWLSHWSSINCCNKLNDGIQFLYIYIIIGVISIFFITIRIITFYEYTLKASTVIHNNLFLSIIRAPMYYFDTTPLGRINNIMTRDIDTVDMTLHNSLQLFLNFSTNVIAILFIISVVTPMLLIPLTPIIVIFYFIQKIYRKTSTQVQRLESVSRSPIYSHFGETLNGVIVLRAFRKINENILKNQYLLDLNNKCYITLQITNQWLGLRLSLLSNLITFFSCLLITYNRSNISIASVGLSISYTLSLTSNLNKSTQQFAEFETKMISVERIVHYTKNIPQEALQIVNYNRAPSNWPNFNGDHSAIIFENVVMGYREGLPILKGISFEINKSNEKIGILGRTGSGKSSLFSALFRLYEITSGSIMIDGVDISKIGLNNLRSQISIIPQDSFLFAGNVRENLDPLNEHSNDDVLWQVIKDVQLFDRISALPNGLESKVLENGSNFSIGQCQLISLGRALLKKSKIICIDEATSNIDPLNDAIIQKVIKNNFKDSIILTIAHRINTILDSDRIMVLDKGEIVEFDKPENLKYLKSMQLNKTSVF